LHGGNQVEFSKSLQWFSFFVVFDIKLLRR
jgi:hypothetical protein